MRATLFPFQESALADLHEKIKKAHAYWSEKDPQVISFTAPTLDSRQHVTMPAG